MKRIKLKINNPHSEYKNDIGRIISVMNDAGFHCSAEEAQKLWEEYSESYAAQWLILPTNPVEIMSNIAPFFDAVETDSNEH